jgi:hypothetical protein
VSKETTFNKKQPQDDIGEILSMAVGSCILDIFTSIRVGVRVTLSILCRLLAYFSFASLTMAALFV